MVGQWGRYLGHVGRQIGGVEIDRKMAGERGAVYTPVSAERQRAAVRFMIDEGVHDADLAPGHRPAGPDRSRPGVRRASSGSRRGRSTGSSTPVRLGRLAEAEWLRGDAYPAAEMMDDVQSGLFAEAARGAQIDPARRSLQRAYVDRLGELMTGPAMSVPAGFASRAYGYTPQDSDRSEVRPLARGALLTLQAEIGRALPRYRRRLAPGPSGTTCSTSRP